MSRLLLLTLAGMALAGPAVAQDKSAIQALNDWFEQAFRAGKMDAIAQMC